MNSKLPKWAQFTILILETKKSQAQFTIGSIFITSSMWTQFTSTHGDDSTKK